MKIRKTLALVAMMGLSSALWAQRERNYIYILDCSQSMVVTYHIWEPTLEYLKNDIARLSESTMVTIVPFQGSVYQQSVRHELKRDLDWAKFEKEVSTYPETLTGTNICQAWDHALNYVDPNKDNYIYLLTDGRDNKNPSPDGTENVCKRIRMWCEHASNAQGYYVALSDEAIDERIRSAVNECPKFKTVDGIENPFGSFERVTMSYNTLDPHDITLPFSAEGRFKAEASSQDANFEVTLIDGAISNGRAAFHVTPRGDLAQLPESFEVSVKVESREVNILNPELTLMVKNLPERSLILPQEEVDLGKAEWYDAFWWSDAKPMDTLSVDLNPQFNEAALSQGASLKLRLSETTTDKDGHAVGLQSRVLYNGSPMAEDGVIEMQAGQPAVLSFIPRTDGREGKHYYQLTLVPHSAVNLENVNQEPISDYELTLRSSYDVDTNPLKTLMTILAIILLGLLAVWFLLLRPMIYKRLKVFSLTISEPYFNSIPVNGALKVVMTSQPRSQSFLSRVFMGKIIYEINPAWTHEWSLVPMGSGAMIMASNHFVDPMDSPVELGVEYKLEDDETREKAVVSVS